MIIIIINIVLITTYPRDGYRDGYIYEWCNMNDEKA